MVGEKTINEWFISIKKNKGDIFDLSNLTHNYPPQGKYWADPFLYSHNGIDYVFYELYDYKKGCVAYSIINDDLTFSDPQIIIDEPYHISYPFIFEDNGEIYMVPESGDSLEVGLYKCIDFPNKWEKQPPLIYNISAGDNNIFKIDNKYWLFTTTQPNLKHYLTILTSENLHGPWKAVLYHEIKNSRSGGKIFYHNNNLIRTVQNASKGYGTGIDFKKITINSEGYGEELYHQIKPDWHPNIFGTHHFDFNDKYIVIDGKRKV